MDYEQIKESLESILNMVNEIRSSLEMSSPDSFQEDEDKTTEVVLDENVDIQESEKIENNEEDNWNSLFEEKR